MHVFKRPLDPVYMEAKISDLTRQNRFKDQEIARLRQALNDQKFDAERLPKLRKEFGNTVEGLKGLIEATTQTALSIENRGLIEEIHALAEGKRNLQIVIADLDTELANAKKERLNANESLRQMQESVFRGQDQPEWGTDTNEAIANELETLFKDARMWCKNNCTRRLPEFSGNPEELPAEWKNVIRPDPTILKHERVPLLILHALLMDFIYRQIFARPFFFIPWRRINDEDEKADSESGDIPQKYQCQLYLENLLEEILQGNPEGGHAWRSQLLRLLDPRLRGEKNERPQLKVTKTRSQAAHQDAAQHLMGSFVKEYAAHLTCKPSNEALAAKELEIIFQTAVRMAHKLWLRRSSLEIQTLDDLPHHFTFDHEVLNDNPTALDGHLIRLVVHPAVLVRGKSDGSEYNDARMLKPAVVWMG
ncbi:hypothetical protein N7493_010263 [Penicillium malachiteum]|uniref:Uncharacterized protein n=1 Tax=Penicillium malachiteum TaxID=1324776 RepID=A0AAD6HCU0_9EURO|nr:hypothetical protein N7493_010263 [Penicillium malachiteum]